MSGEIRPPSAPGRRAFLAALGGFAIAPLVAPKAVSEPEFREFVTEVTARPGGGEWGGFLVPEDFREELLRELKR